MSARAAESSSNVTGTVAGALALWFAIIFFLGWSESFVRPPGTAPLPILAGVTVPLLVFLAAFPAMPAFRDFVLNADLRLVTGIQAWRFMGLGFLALYTYGILPGLFAWPAGLGDIAIGVTAPWIALALIRAPAFAGSRLFRVWNVLGIADLVVAVSAGVLATSMGNGGDAEITTAPMARLPLVLIPAFLVPVSTMLHLTALLQARELRLSERQQWRPSPVAGTAPGALFSGKANHGDHTEPYNRTGS
jgi:hypothetical protein